jgi:trk system potassium uptake protein TrkA
MNIVIVGMGEVGRYISSVLVSENHNVVIIDSDQDALQQAEETLDVMVLRGHGASLKTLTQANSAEADLFIAVTDNCEVNILSAIRAKELGAKRTIARVSQPAYYENERGMITGMMGIDLIINPNALIAMEMHKIIRSTSAVAVEDFADNRIEMIQLPMDAKSPLVDKMLKDIRLPDNTLVAAMIRDHEIIVPGGSDSIREDDELLFVGKIEQIPKVEKLVKRERRRYTRRVIIVGGSQVSVSLAKALAADHIEVLII